MSDFFAKPLSLYSIPAVWLTVLLPAALKLATIQKTAGFNNVAPRANTQRLAATESIPRDLSARVARMEAAHYNGNEMLPLWIAGVLAGNHAGLENSTMNKASILYIVLRSLYNYVYINQTTRSQSLLRSSLFWAAFSAPTYLIIKAANKLYAEAP